MHLFVQACVTALITLAVGQWIGAFAFSVVAALTMAACAILLLDDLRLHLARATPEIDPHLAHALGSVLLSSAGMGLIWPAVPAILLWGTLTNGRRAA